MPDRGQKWEHCWENPRTGYLKNDRFEVITIQYFSACTIPRYLSNVFMQVLAIEIPRNVLKALRYYKKFLSVGR